jgi:hypothetical protein
MKKDKNGKKTGKSVKELKEQYREWLKGKILEDYMDGLGIASSFRGIRVLREEDFKSPLF